jgi:hypothetical protein
MSLDGLIAGPGGDMSWMTDYFGPNPVVDELITQTGALLVGNRTFGGDDPLEGQEGEGEAFGGGWEGQQFVVTHRPPAEQFRGRRSWTTWTPPSLRHGPLPARSSSTSSAPAWPHNVSRPVYSRHRIARASACTPVTICDSLRLAYPSANPGGAVSGSA